MRKVGIMARRNASAADDTRRLDANAYITPPSRESVAYDYSRFDTRERLAPPPAELEVIKPRRRERTSELAFITPNLIIMVMILASLCVAVVWSSMVLTERTAQATGLKTQLNNLKSQATLLEAKQDERFSLAVVEAYATDELKMVKLTPEQLRYIDISNPDEIVVLDPDAQTEKQPLLTALLERFGVNNS